MSGVTADSEKPSGTCHVWCRPRAGTPIVLFGFCVKPSQGPSAPNASDGIVCQPASRRLVIAIPGSLPAGYWYVPTFST